MEWGRMMSYKAFVSTFEGIENHVELRYCGCAAPRNQNNWPTIEPEAMDDLQVMYEAASWRITARSTSPNTVGGSLWLKYTDELIRRGLMDVDCQKRFDISKVMTKGWNDLPPGPIIVDPVVPAPIQFDPKEEPSLTDRIFKFFKTQVRIN